MGGSVGKNANVPERPPAPDLRGIARGDVKRIERQAPGVGRRRATHGGLPPRASDRMTGRDDRHPLVVGACQTGAKGLRARRRSRRPGPAGRVRIARARGAGGRHAGGLRRVLRRRRHRRWRCDRPRIRRRLPGCRAVSIRVRAGPCTESRQPCRQSEHHRAPANEAQQATCPHQIRRTLRRGDGPLHPGTCTGFGP